MLKTLNNKTKAMHKYAKLEKKKEFFSCEISQNFLRDAKQLFKKLFKKIFFE